MLTLILFHTQNIFILSASTLCSNYRSASHWWSEALQTILQTTDPLNSWRGLVAPTKAVEMPLEGCGVWGCVVGGMLAAKLAKYVCIHFTFHGYANYYTIIDIYSYNIDKCGIIAKKK